MTDENVTSVIEDGDKVDEKEKKANEKESKENQPNQPKQRSVSFNRDVHVKRFGKTRDTRSGSGEPSIRKEPFTHLSEKELIEEANKVIAQAESVTCTADHPPEKFFSLPYRRKFKAETSPSRRNSDEFTTEERKSTKSSLGRSTSDVSSKKNTKERTSLSTLFRRAQRNKSPEEPIVVATKPISTVKRSKSDVSDHKSNTTLTSQPKPIRKRSGSETEEFLKSLRNKKTQLSPIIESSPREDYFKKTPPLEVYQKQKLFNKDNNKPEDNNSKQNFDSDNKKVNPIEKPPRHKLAEAQDSEPKPPIRNKRGKSAEKERTDQSPPIVETPKKKTDVKKTLLVDEIDNKSKELVEVKEKIKAQIKKIQDNIYGSKEMIHSSQQPPDKPPLTRGHTVDYIVRILKEDQQTTPPKAHIISPPNNGSNNNQPFSYIKPSISPDPNLYVRSTSPDRPTSPVNKMNTNKGIVYAQVVKGDQGEYKTNHFGKQTIHKTYSPLNDKNGNFSDEDEGLGYEDQKNKFSIDIKYDDEYKNIDTTNSSQNFKIIDSPIKPRFREYKLKSFEDFEPTYTNEYPSKDDRSQDFIDGPIRGRADGMDTKRKNYAEPEIAKGDIDFNELTHRRQLLESRLKARRYDRNRINSAEPISRYLAETDPIYEAEKRMKATEKYVNDTARYYRNTLEREERAESSIIEDYNKTELHNNRVKYNAETRTFERIPKDEMNRREFIDTLRNGTISNFRDDDKNFPPEPEYEPPSLDSHAGKPVLSPDEYTEKKYRTKSRNFTSSHDMLQSSQKYSKNREDWFGKRKGHYASNPEIAQDREDYYANVKSDSRHQESYHNSLRRNRDFKDKYYGHDIIHRHDSGDSRDYAYRDDRSPKRFDIDSRLVDSGIENDFRKDSNGEIHRSTPRYRIHESDEDVRNTSLLLASERKHTEDNYPSEQIYANGEYITRFEDFRPDEYPSKTYIPREHSADNGSQFDSKVGRIENSPTNRYSEKLSSKPPKAVKKLSGLEKMKQLFSRDSSKKSKKEKETVQSTKTRTRVLKSPEHLARDDPEYRRYRDPEPSDDDLRRKEYDLKNSDPESNYRKDYDRRYNDYKENDISQKHKDRYLRDSDQERYREPERQERRRYERDLKEVKLYKEERKEGPLKRYKEYTGSSEDRDSDHRSPKPYDMERELKTSREKSRTTRSKTADPIDSPTLAERYRGRRRLATPSPTPSPPPAPRATGWFKSLDRLSRKKSNNKVEKESVITTEDESVIQKTSAKNRQPLSPAKNLRFFGDTDPESDAHTQNYTKTKNQQTHKHSTLRKTISNSSTGIDEINHSGLSGKSHSLSNIHKQSKREESPMRTHKRNLHNISEIQSNSEAESHFDRKPPIGPYDRRSRSHSSSKNVKTKNRSDSKTEERISPSELRGSRQELARDVKNRRRTPGGNSGGSSTEGESSRQSQRSVVYLHATTVGDIPDPGVLARNRSRDDVSSVNSSQLQVRTTTKSFSIFAPWTPRHQDNDVHYAQRPRKTRSRDKETLKRSSANRNLTDDKPILQKNKSYSQTTLTKRPQNNRLSASSTTLYRKSEKRSVENLAKPTTLARSKNVGKDTKKSQSTEVLHREGREKVSRSISMPKDKDKKSGWFKLSNKNKKTDINTRVR